MSVETCDQTNDIGNEWSSKKTSNERKNEGKSKRTSSGKMEWSSDLNGETVRLSEKANVRMTEPTSDNAIVLSWPKQISDIKSGDLKIDQYFYCHSKFMPYWLEESLGRNALELGTIEIS